MIEAPDGLGWGPEGQDSLRYARIARDVDDKENGVGVLEYQAELSRYPLQIIVTTCDDYRGLMPALADRFNFYWPNVKKVDVLCFEEPDRLPPNFLQSYRVGRRIWQAESLGEQEAVNDGWNVWSVRPSIIHYADVVQKGVLNLETPGGV